VFSRGDDPPRPPGSWGDPSPQTPFAGAPRPPYAPALQRPPLTARLRAWHWAVLDYVAGALITVVLFATILRSFRRAVISPYGSHYFVLPMTAPLALFLAAVAGVAVALRRRRPVFALGVLLVGSLVVTALSGPGGASLLYFLPATYVLYLVAAGWEQRRDAVRVLAAVFVTLLADIALLVIGWNAGFSPAGAMLVALCAIIAWTAGYTVRQRRRYAVRLQDEAASRAVAQERLRIARELHDVVAHSMSVIAVQAGYGQYVIDTQPGDARDALGAIQATSRDALDEMRRMLSALRHADEGDARNVGAGSAARIRTDTDPEAGADRAGGVDGTGAPLLPAPGLADLDRLVSRTAGAGVRVDVTRVGDPRDLPASIDLSAYRIVQEALTNVVKHAQTSSCQALIGYGADELTIEVTDNGAGVPVQEMAGARPVAEMAGAGAAAAHRGGVLVSAARGIGAPGAGHDDSLVRSAFSGVAASGVAASGATASGAAASGRAAGRVLSHGPSGGGHGIIGMRERVSLLGGEFSAGPLPGYGFRVSARIPLPSGSR
jgi:signal transduction histidine kinase